MAAATTSSPNTSPHLPNHTSRTRRPALRFSQLTPAIHRVSLPARPYATGAKDNLGGYRSRATPHPDPHHRLCCRMACAARRCLGLTHACSQPPTRRRDIIRSRRVCGFEGDGRRQSSLTRAETQRTPVVADVPAKRFVDRMTGGPRAQLYRRIMRLDHLDRHAPPRLDIDRREQPRHVPRRSTINSSLCPDGHVGRPICRHCVAGSRRPTHAIWRCCDQDR
jgi:hypothetical protein